MKITTRSALAFASISAVLTAGLMPTGALAFGAPTPASAVIDFEAEPRSPGAVSEDALQAAETIGQLIDTNPEQFTGVRVDGAQAVTVTLPAGADAAHWAGIVHSRVSVGSKVSIKFEHARRSRSAMRSVKSDIGKLIRTNTYPGQILGVGVDPSRGVAVVYGTDQSEAARAALKERFGDAIVFRRMSQPKLAEADRQRDTAPHFGGAAYTTWNSGHTAAYGHCSTAFPIVKSGVRYMLTAGHCMPGSTGFPSAWAEGYTSNVNGAYSFGGMYTTTVGGRPGSLTDGTQDSYGDWALLGGSTYDATVYNCGNTSGTCSYLRVGEASWGTPAYKTQICTSGRTTAQVCRQFVTDTDWEGTIEGLYFNNLVMFRGDPNLNGSYDCNTPTVTATIKDGDSGGAVYQGISGRPGYLRAMGMVTAGEGCTSWYSPLSGIRAWNSSITMPVY